MRCEEFLERFDLLSDAESGRLPLEPGEHEALRKHLRECPDCRYEADLANGLARAVKALPAVEATALAGALSPRSRSTTRRIVAAFSGIAALATVAVILLAPGRQATKIEEVPLASRPAIFLPDLPLDAAPEARSLVEAIRDPGGRQNLLARLRTEPELASSFMAVARAAAEQFKASHSGGDLDDMLSCLRLVEHMDSLLLGSANPIVFSAPEYERVFLTNGFWLGYTLFALGDFDGARAVLRDYIGRIDDVEREQGLSGLLQVYRDARAKDVLEFLETRAGKPVPVDLDLGNSWVTGKRLRLADCRGKIVALVFRGAEDQRSGSFLGPLSALCAKMSDVHIATVTYYHGASTPAEQHAKLTEDLERLGYEGPAGFDPDADHKSIFRSFRVNVGSATFVVVDKRGGIAWYMPDPRGNDVRFAERLLLRLAAR